MTTSPFVVNRWIPIYANSSIIHYTGDWNFTTYKPLTENSTASLNFTGSGISFAGYGNAGDETDEGILVNIDADSDSPYNTTLLLSYDYRGGSVNQGYRWFSKELPPGEHTVSALAKADNLNVTFVGFEVYINTTVPANSGVTQITENSTLLPENGQYWDLEYFGTQSKGDNSTTTVTGANSGFSFNFTGVALSIFAQEEFEQDTPYQVYFNLSDPTGSSKGSPYGEYPGKTGPANQIFWAGDLPAGEHKVVVINQGDSPLTLTSAVVDLPQFYNNQSTTCWADCKDATSGSGTAIGTTHDENGALSPKVGWGVMLAGLAMASAGVLTAL